MTFHLVSSYTTAVSHLRMMQRNLVLLVAATALLVSASAQSPQTGLLYWCSFVEGGTNMAAQVNTAGLPRTTVNAAQTFYSGPCHLPYAPAFPYTVSDANTYTYSNGTAYPANSNCGSYPFCPYNIAPSACLTADNWATDPVQCAVPGFGYSPLYVNNGGTNPISSFPITYDQKLACNNTVYTSSIVDSTNNAYVYGQLYAWKVGLEDIRLTKNKLNICMS